MSSSLNRYWSAARRIAEGGRRFARVFVAMAKRVAGAIRAAWSWCTRAVGTLLRIRYSATDEVLSKLFDSKEAVAAIRDRELDEQARLTRTYAELGNKHAILAQERLEIDGDPVDTALVVEHLECALEWYNKAKPTSEAVRRGLGALLEAYHERYKVVEAEIKESEAELARLQSTMTINDIWCGFFTLGIGNVINHAVNDPRRELLRQRIADFEMLKVALERGHGLLFNQLQSADEMVDHVRDAADEAEEACKVACMPGIKAKHILVFVRGMVESADEGLHLCNELTESFVVDEATMEGTGGDLETLKLLARPEAVAFREQRAASGGGGGGGAGAGRAAQGTAAAASNNGANGANGAARDTVGNRQAQAAGSHAGGKVRRRVMQSVSV